MRDARDLKQQYSMAHTPEMERSPEALPANHGVPDMDAPSIAILRGALVSGWQDFKAAPVFGLLAALACILAGWMMVGVTYASGHTFWLILMVFGFPLAAPFAAFGTYEVSRRRAAGQRVSVGAVLRVMWGERNRQLPWLCAIMIVVLLFWFFLGHMIFALFLGLAPMTNISSSLTVFLTPDGVMMLGMGTVVGAGFALLLFSMCVIGLPLLLDREVDYVTAMLTSIQTVMAHPWVMLPWAVFVAGVCLLALLPGFLGLLIVLPWLGHASWHVYAALLGTPQGA